MGFSVSRGVNDELDGSSQGSPSRQMPHIWEKTLCPSQAPPSPDFRRAVNAQSHVRPVLVGAGRCWKTAEEKAHHTEGSAFVVVVNDSIEIKPLPEEEAFLMGFCSRASLERAIASHQYSWQPSAGTTSIGNYFLFFLKT